MSFGGNNGVGQTVQTLDPRIYDQWANVNNFAKDLAGQDDPFYNGATHAGDNSLYTDARSTITQAQQAGRGATDQAAGVFGSVANDSPVWMDPALQGPTAQGQAGQIGDVLDVNPDRASAGNIAGSSLSPYMNQYQGAVIDQSNREIDRSKQMADNQNAYSASRAGAFGGSRHGILDAENERNYAQMKQDNTNSLLQSGYGQAQGLLQSDIDRQAGISQFNAGQFNQAFTGNADRDLAARGADAAARQSASFANAGAENQRNQFNAGQTQSANDAYRQADLAQSGLNLQGAQGLLSSGQQQQALMLNQAGALTGAGDKLRESQNADYANAQDQWNAQYGEGDRDLARMLQPFGILPSTTSGGVTNSNSKSKGYAT